MDNKTPSVVAEKLKQFRKESGNQPQPSSDWIWLRELWNSFWLTFMSSRLIADTEIEWFQSGEHYRGMIDVDRIMMQSLNDPVQIALRWAVLETDGTWIMQPEVRHYTFIPVEYKFLFVGDKVVCVRSHDDYFIIHFDGERLDMNIVK